MCVCVCVCVYMCVSACVYIYLIAHALDLDGNGASLSLGAPHDGLVDGLRYSVFVLDNIQGLLKQISIIQVPREPDDRRDIGHVRHDIFRAPVRACRTRVPALEAHMPHPPVHTPQFSV